MPDPSVQPPEGLRHILAEAEGARRNGVASDGRGWFRTAADRVDCYAVADAVLAALLDACEIRERWGTRWTLADGGKRTAWWSSRAEAETERDWPTSASRVELLRRCDLQTPPESAGPYRENRETTGG
jgi:hypothetical protein